MPEQDAPATPTPDDHSASRRVDVREQEAPHLIAPREPLESEAHDA